MSNKPKFSIHISNIEEFKLCQNVLFEMGYSWNINGYKSKKIRWANEINFKCYPHLSIYYHDDSIYRTSEIKKDKRIILTAKEFLISQTLKIL